MEIHSRRLQRLLITSKSQPETVNEPRARRFDKFVACIIRLFCVDCENAGACNSPAGFAARAIGFDERALNREVPGYS